MVLKLGISSLRNLKLESIMRKKIKYASVIGPCRTIPIAYHSTFHKKISFNKYWSSSSLESVRAINIPSTLWTKVVPFKLSDIGEGIVEVTVKEWFVKPGDVISQFDNICEVQSDKASVTITSRYDGTVKKLHYNVDDTAKVGHALIDIEVSEDDDGANSSSDSDEELDGKPDKNVSKSSVDNDVVNNLKAKALATPAVRRIAKESNVNILDIKGTGRDGRVLKEDILAFIQGTGAPTPPTKPLPFSKQPLSEKVSVQPAIRPSQPVFGLLDKDRKEQITGFKKAMVKSMTNAWTIPHFSYCDEIGITEFVKFKDEIKRISQSTGVKLTFMPFFVKAASLALLKYPQLNSHIDDKCEYLTIKAAHNIGIAMDTQFGLVVPNVKNVQQLSVIEIGNEINRLQTLGAMNQLGINDLKDGTFTLSNIGSIGGTYTKPIIFSPQVIIGALGKIQTVPRFDENKNVIEAHIFNISWSADHRVVDGATVARFSNLWKAYLSAPKLLLEL